MLVREIQNITHSVTRYTAFELKRHYRDRSKPHPKWPALRRKRAAEIMREWRRRNSTAQDSQQSEKTTTPDV
jgi:hypothetical protein